MTSEAVGWDFRSSLARRFHLSVSREVALRCQLGGAASPEGWTGAENPPQGATSWCPWGLRFLPVVSPVDVCVCVCVCGGGGGGCHHSRRPAPQQVIPRPGRRPSTPWTRSLGGPWSIFSSLRQQEALQGTRVWRLRTGEPLQGTSGVSSCAVGLWVPGFPCFLFPRRGRFP